MGCVLTVCTGASDSRGEHRLLLHNSSSGGNHRELYLSKAPEWLPISTEHFRFIEYCDWKYEMDHARAVQTILLDRYGSIDEVILLIHSMLAGSIFRCERTVEYNFDHQIKHEYKDQYSIEELQFRFESALVKTLLDIDLSQTGNSTSATLLDSIIQHSGRTHFRRNSAAAGTGTSSVKSSSLGGQNTKPAIECGGTSTSTAGGSGGVSGITVDSDSDDLHPRSVGDAVIGTSSAMTAAVGKSSGGSGGVLTGSAFDVGSSPMRHVLRVKIVDFAQSNRNKDAYTKTIVLENGSSIYFDITEEGAWHNLTKKAFETTDVFLIVVRFSKASYTSKASAWMNQFWKYKKRVIDRLKKKRDHQRTSSFQYSSDGDGGKGRRGIKKKEKEEMRSDRTGSENVSSKIASHHLSEQDDFDAPMLGGSMVVPAGVVTVDDDDEEDDEVQDNNKHHHTIDEEEKKYQQHEMEVTDCELRRDNGRLQFRHSSDFDLDGVAMTAAIDTLGSISSVEPSPERLYSSPTSRLSMSSTADTFSDLLDAEARRGSGSTSAPDSGNHRMPGSSVAFQKKPSLLPTLSVLESEESMTSGSSTDDAHIPAVVFCAAGIRHPVWDVHNPVLIPQMIRFAQSHNLPFVEVNVNENKSLGTGSSEDILALFEFMYKYQMCHQHFVVSQIPYY